MIKKFVQKNLYKSDLHKKLAFLACFLAQSETQLTIPRNNLNKLR